MEALVHVDHLADAAVPRGQHQLFRLIPADLALLDQKCCRLRFQYLERLVEIPVDADGDPGVFGLDARPLELGILENLHGNVHFLVGGLECGEVDLAVALRRVRIAGPQQTGT